MKKFLTFLLVLACLSVVAIMTCPDRQAHKDAILGVVNESIAESVAPGASEHSADKALGALIGSLGSGIAGWMIDGRLQVKNHFVCSTGEVTDLNGKNNLVSVGVFGHVFTFGKEQLKKALTGAE